MLLIQKSFARNFVLLLVFTLCSLIVFAQTNTGELRGTVTDELGGIIVGAAVTVDNNKGIEKTIITDKDGFFTISKLLPGKYTIRVSSENFAVYENKDVQVSAGQRTLFDIKLGVVTVKAEVSVGESSAPSTEPDKNTGVIVLRSEELEIFPDEPEDLAAALQALAGPSAGPNGSRISVDGFSGSDQIPPKESIREVRINQNPFSSEYDRLGFGHIEIFTKPGTAKLQGQGSFNFSDQKLNSRSPFVRERTPFQTRVFGGNLSGPLSGKKATYFLNFNYMGLDENIIVRATVLDSSLAVVPFSQSVPIRQRNISFNPRFDYQINKNNTFTARYSYFPSKSNNVGVGGFVLPSRATDITNNENTIQLSETAVINQKIVNEIRFQYHYHNNRRKQVDDNSSPSITVLDAFSGGGSPIRAAINRENRWELQNNITWIWRSHTFRAGGRWRGGHIDETLPQNFNGTYTFSGGIAPQLNADNQIVFNTNGQSIPVIITSIERYWRTLLFQQQGFTPAQIRALGGGASQFSIAAGNPRAQVKQMDFGAFWQDDWRVRPNFTLSLGLRYEAQTNVTNNLNFAPRIAFAWSPGEAKKGQPATVVRGGFGIFYERLNEFLTLQASRFNGLNQQQFIVTDPSILDSFPNVPSIETLAGFAARQTTWRVAPDIRSPYTIQSSISIERRLPLKLNLTATFINSRVLHLLRALNINAPLPGTLAAGINNSGIRPFGSAGNIFQYESSGIFNQKQLIINVSRQPTKRLSFTANYTLNKAESDTDGINNFPANPYDFSNEYGRSALDVRHRLFINSSIGIPWNMRLNTFILASSGRPFNITTGRDTNGDSVFTERPAFATDLTRSSVINTRYGTFELEPLPEQTIIPRNVGTGPGFFAVNLALVKTFDFGSEAKQSSDRGNSSMSQTQKRYKLSLSLTANNILNRVNLDTPVSNLSSPLFGQSTSALGGFGFATRRGVVTNRRINLLLTFSF
jgi:hypothetical protein